VLCPTAEDSSEGSTKAWLGASSVLVIRDLAKSCDSRLALGDADRLVNETLDRAAAL
jgi:hypothetical protein